MAIIKFDGWKHLLGKTYIRQDSWNWDCAVTLANREGETLICNYTGRVLATK